MKPASNTPSPVVLRRLLRTLKLQPGTLFAALLSTVLVTLFDVTIPLLSANAIDAATGVRVGNVQTIVWVLVAVALARYGFQFGRRYTAGRLSNTLQHHLRTQILGTLLHVDGPTQDRIRTGQVVSRSISDLNLTQAMVAMMPLITGHILKVIITLGILLWISPLLSLIAVAVVPILIWLTFRSRRVLFAATWSSQQAMADLASHVEESITGIRIVKAFAAEDTELRKLNDKARTLYAQRLRQADVQARFQPLLQQLPNFAAVAGIALGGWLALQGTISIGVFFAFSSYLTSLTGVASMLAGMIVQIQLGFASASRVFEVLDLAPAKTPKDSPQTKGKPDSMVGLSVRGVSFSQDIARAPGSMSTAQDSTPRQQILQDLDLEIRAGETVALVGPPGSGKTMLVQLLCGFYSPEQGSIGLQTDSGVLDYDDIDPVWLREHVIACVFDDPFLFSASVRDNITMGRDYPMEEIEAAAKAAQADEFIAKLDHGYEEIIGERGLTLSGGQRQRIAIARALLLKPKILILDDATSAIDAITERKIYAHLRSQLSDVTILAIAHRTSTLELADRVALIEQGCVRAIGNLNSMQSNAAFATLMDLSLHEGPRTDPLAQAKTLSDDIDPQSLWPEVDSQDQQQQRISRQLGKTQQSMAGANPLAGGTGKGNRGSSGGMAAAATPPNEELLARVAALPPAKATPSTDGLEYAQPLNKVTAAGLFAHVRWLILGVIALYVAGVLAGLSIPALVKRAIDEAVIPGLPSVLWQVTFIGIAVVSLAWVAEIATTKLTMLTGERLLYQLRIRSFAHLHRLGMDYYEKTMSGTIITRMTTDIDALNNFLQTGLATFVVAATTLAGILILLFLTSVKLSLIALAGVPIIVLATVVFRSISTTLYARAREEISEVNAHFHESVSGIRTMQMHNMQDQRIEDFSRLSEIYRKTRINTQTAVAVYFPGMNALGELAQAAVLAVGAVMVTNGQLATGILVAFLLYLSRLYGPIQHLSQVFDSYQQAQVGFRRISDLLSTRPSIQAQHAGQAEPAAAATGSICFEHVDFGYSSDKLVSQDLNVCIEPGTTVAVVGPTGAGKSTFVKLIERFYDPVQGRVCASGQNIRDFSVRRWRNHIGFVPQETYLMAGTIADNIAYGKPDATREEITQAAQRVGALAAIAQIPGGFHAYVGERGRNLSSGQRQLIALARAEMMHPDILLLDEATATLDPATEAIILHAAQKVTEGRTAIIVAHRLATAAKADRILVIDHGAIIEDGNHESLLAQGGTYAKMWG